MLYLIQLRRHKSFGYQFLRRSTTTSVLNKASQVDQPVIGDLHLPEQEDAATKPTAELSQSPVCAYNEWDPLEVDLTMFHAAYTVACHINR